ncbi:DUF4132 domain-containing protein [Actinoplanes sp. NPDC049265]|uniref:DUF4132 domain-containing protein n=1 Tax=Actinoplanes sp. NPDC049265 TaxID=3363902 RepID=UPI0037213DBE
MRENVTYLDEDVLLLPDDWDPPLAVRGETEVRPVKARSLEVVDGILAATAPEAAAVLAREAVAPEVASAPPDSPLRAATLAYIADRNTGGLYNDLREESRESPTLRRHLADAWVSGRGLAFAVRAVTDLARMSHDSRMLYEFDTHFMRRHDPQRFEDEKHTGLWRTDEVSSLAAAGPILVRLRELVAGLPDDEYAAMLETLAELRAELPAEMRVMTSFLAPTQSAWIEEDFATWELPTTPDWRKGAQSVLLTGCVRDPDRLASQIGRAGLSGDLPGILTTYVSLVGERSVEHFKGSSQSGKWLWALPYDSAYRLQRDRMGDVDALPWLALASERFPARAVRLLAEDDDHEPAAELLRQHVLAHPEVAAQVLPALTGAQREKVAVVLAELDAVGPGAVPPILAQPPWTIKTKATKPVVIEGLRCDDPLEIDWLPGERPKITDGEWAGQVNQALAQNFDVGMLKGTVDDVRPLVREFRVSHEYLARVLLPGLIDRFELDAFPVASDYLRQDVKRAARFMLPYTSPELAVTVATWNSRLKSVRGVAREWFDRHPAAAARALIPNALGRSRAARREAEEALSLLAELGHDGTVREAAAGYGPEAAAAIGALLEPGRKAVGPVRIPKIWPPLRSGVLPPLLRDGTGRLPASVVPDLLTVFMLSTFEKPYEAVAAVKDALDPADLARFAWDLLRRWCTTGTQSKHDWVFTVLGLAGDDDTARRLAKTVLSAPYVLGARAGRALEAMQAIGTDAALIQLQRVAQRSSVRPFRTIAEQRISEVAAKLGLTAGQLADRLVPDFGLAATGALTIDYGSRRFFARFDEKLIPYVTDENGRRLSALPKPGAKDDRELAEASAKSFAEVKKNLRTVVDGLLSRYELAMVERYEWSVADFRTYLAGHRLVAQIVRRLLWTVDGVPVRIAEDGTFADVDDELVEAAEGIVTVAHPVQLGTDLEAWLKAFDDYQIMQPFPQLTRETYRLTAEETESGRLVRFEGAEVTIARLRRLEERGWRPGAEEHGGIVYEFSRRFPRGGGLTITLETGFPIGGARDSVSRLDTIELDGAPGDAHDPIACSELIRDLSGVITPEAS